MRLIQSGLCHILLITALLYTTEAKSSGCMTWSIDPRNNGHVCCEQCHPGNRLVAECGPDRSALCTPCEPNTYTVLPLTKWCHSCTQCIEPQVQVKPCNTTADTVCGCKTGYRCGDQGCNFCVRECTKGEEPTRKRNCQKCPEGTFNDKTHSACKPWTKSCPAGKQMISPGNEFRDIQCGKGLETSTTSSDNFFYPLVGIFTAISVLIIIMFSLLWFAYKRTKNKSQSKDLKPTTPTPGELNIIIVEHEEACSFHQPEQEQGGSSESINTQDSESKLIV